MQPHVVVISEDNKMINATYYAVLTELVYYETVTMIEAVDIAYKACFVLGLDFPHAANSSWMFLEKGIYNMTSKYDRVPSKVLELVTELKDH